MKTFLITDYGVQADDSRLQTKEIQNVLDMCRDGGGTVIIPCGTFYVSSLYMHSDTTLFLESGARLIGSEECDDYEVFPFPEGMVDRSDMEMIRQYYGKPWAEYRRAIISAYCEHNLTIIGEQDSIMDGRNCYDPNGEEGYRGPHGIYFTNCENITLHGYTIQHTGNFMHQLDLCKNTTVTNVTCYSGSDAIHLHHCDNTLIDSCKFHTGDDCIAGIYVTNLLVRRCDLNTSCDVFRIGGVHIHVEDCHIHGPGIWPHRKTVVRGKHDELPQDQGRHNTICVMIYFSSVHFPDPEPSHDIVFRNCLVENVDRFLIYDPADILEKGTNLVEVSLENVTFIGLDTSSYVRAPEDNPLQIRMKNVRASFRENAACTLGLFDGSDPNTHITEEV